MCAETLLVIYDLLKREVASLSLDLQRARDARADADYDDPSYPSLDLAYKDAYALLQPVKDALNDFKAVHWYVRVGE